MTDWTATELGEIITEIAGIRKKIEPSGRERTERERQVINFLVWAEENLVKAKEIYEG